MASPAVPSSYHHQPEIYSAASAATSSPLVLGWSSDHLSEVTIVPLQDVPINGFVTQVEANSTE
jgi:hypothetical protein